MTVLPGRSPVRPGMALLALVFAGALTVRLMGVAESPVTFHPTRQYLGLRVARAEYLAGRSDVLAEVQRAVRRNASDAPRLEPRLLEAAVVAGYRVLGGERVWLGGALSSVLWVVGAAVLFLIARRLASDLAAAVAVVFYLFVPYAIVASRSFQPDPAMVVVMLAAVLALLRHHDQPTSSRLAAAAALSAVSILIKPTVVFAIAGVVVALAFSRGGLRKGVLQPATAVLLALSLLPAAAFYIDGIVAGAATASNAETSFIPRLVGQAAYWKGWLRIVEGTVGTAFLVVAASSVAAARRREARLLIGGLLAGYAVYGLVFNYHIHTHDYYSLQLIPMVGLGLGLAVDAAAARLKRMALSPVMRAAPAVTLAALGVMVLYAGRDVVRPHPIPSVATVQAQSEAIGELVSHSTQTVMLAPAYGWPLGYYGSVAGTSWPSASSGDFRAMRFRGERMTSAGERLDQVVASGAEWFIVTDLPELARQPDLRDLLETSSRLAGQGKGFLVYDLRPA